ncbi:MAG: 23S rRNA (guanosine(2251)-2'-O)-methyltransferase RlmB [Proteobacteria bacterium]|nr:23S rRNA (guanosine(2251)-2'-O)-methyltransferase RlmB [Pseudomonadota bacterium]
MSKPPRHEQRRPWQRPERKANTGERRDGQGYAPRRRDEPEGPLRIWGIHAAEAALANAQRTVNEILLTETAESRLAEVLKQRGAKSKRVTPRDLDRLLGNDTVHQGALLEVEALPEASLDDAVALAGKGGPLVVLDQVTDPHNVGAILRSSAVFGAAALIMTRRHSPPLGGALAKAASGALELVPIVLVPNLARALDDLTDAGVRLVGLDGEADADIAMEEFSQPAGIVLGSEGKGLRRLTQEHCDALVRIGASGGLASLNVSNAAAVALYAAKARRDR